MDGAAVVVAGGEVAGAGVVAVTFVVDGAGVVEPDVVDGAGVVTGGGEVAGWVVLTPSVVAHASAEAVVKGSNTVTTGAAKPIAAIRLRNPRRSCAPAPVCGSITCSSGWLPGPSVAIAESYHGRATLLASSSASRSSSIQLGAISTVSLWSPKHRRRVCGSHGGLPTVALLLTTMQQS